MPSKDPEIRRIANRVGGYAVHARYGSGAIAARARDGLHQKFVNEVQEAANARGEVLTKAELDQRVEMARKEHFSRLALKSAHARKQGKGPDAA